LEFSTEVKVDALSSKTDMKPVFDAVVKAAVRLKRYAAKSQKQKGEVNGGRIAAREIAAFERVHIARTNRRVTVNFVLESLPE
jgi:hypothetical protein